MSNVNNLNLPTSDGVHRWVVTGAAGFIGSHLVEGLLSRKQKVIGVDNFFSGSRDHLSGFMGHPDFKFIEGDIRNSPFCDSAFADTDFILHHAAQVSVPLSIQDPVLTDSINNGGFLSVLGSAKKCGVKRVIFASSSSVYGDSQSLPSVEDVSLCPLSPYAVTKLSNELYAHALSKAYQMDIIGLRYFNVYGPRQNPNGAYAAVVARWMNQMQQGQQIEIYGDGTTSRDFCYVQDVVQANIQAALHISIPPGFSVYNIASGAPVSLNELFQKLRHLTGYTLPPRYEASRPGDIKASHADISKASSQLGFRPSVTLDQGLRTILVHKDTAVHG